MKPRPVLVVLLAGNASHAAEVGTRVALCGAVGATLVARVTSAFDVTCPRCAEGVIATLGLTPLTDDGNVRLKIVDDGGDDA